MRIYHHYLMTLAFLFCGTTVVLAVGNKQELDLYFAVFFIEFLVTTLFFPYMDRRARHLLSLMGYIMFSGFLIIIAIKIIQFSA